MLRKSIMILSAAAMTAMPVAAAAAPMTANPAASLSLGQGARAAASAGHKNRLLGGGTGVLIAVAIAAGVAAILAVGLSRENSASG